MKTMQPHKQQESDVVMVEALLNQVHRLMKADRSLTQQRPVRQGLADVLKVFAPGLAQDPAALCQGCGLPPLGEKVYVNWGKEQEHILCGSCFTPMVKQMHERPVAAAQPVVAH